MQKRGVLPSEVHAAFPDRTAKQISDCLTDYVSRQRMRKVTITSRSRRYRYVAIERVNGKDVEVGGEMSEIKPEMLPIVRI